MFKMAVRKHCAFCIRIYFSTREVKHSSHMSFWHNVTTLLTQPCLLAQLNLIKAQSHSYYVEIAPRRVHFPQFHRTVHLSNLQCLILKVSQVKIAHLLIFWWLCRVKYFICYIIWIMRKRRRRRNNSKLEASLFTVWEVRFAGSGNQIRFLLCGGGVIINYDKLTSLGWI